MKTLPNACCLLALLAAPYAAQAGEITYTLDLPSVSGATVTGTITTDGTLGTLANANIVSWNILLTNGAAQADLTPTSSGDSLSDNVVSATSTALSFNFGSAANSVWIFQEPFVGSGDFTGIFCIQTTNCTGAGSDNYQIAVNGTLVNSPQLSGTVTFATAPAPAPLPAAFWLLLSGLGGLGFLARKRDLAT